VQRALSLKENHHIKYLAQRSSFKNSCMDTQAYTTNCSTGPLNFVQQLANHIVIACCHFHLSMSLLSDIPSSTDRATSHTQCIRSGLLWQSRTQFVCLSVGHTDELCKKRLNGSKMPFGRLAHVVQRNHVLDGVKTGRIHSQPQGVQVGDVAICQIPLDTCYTQVMVNMTKWPIAMLSTTRLGFRGFYYYTSTSQHANIPLETRTVNIPHAIQRHQ